MSACSDTPALASAGVGVAELVRGELAQARGCSSPGELVSDRVLAETVAVMGEEEAGGPSHPIRRLGRGRPADRVVRECNFNGVSSIFV